MRPAKASTNVTASANISGFKYFGRLERRAKPPAPSFGMST
jgi:hypothetical protein